MLKLEVSVSLVVGLLLVNAQYLLPQANPELLDDDSWKASFDVTYTPDSQLSDATSWLAWGDVLQKTNTNETLVEGASAGGGSSQASTQTSSQASGLAAANPSEDTAQSFSDRMESIQVAPTQRLWKGESWSDGIAIDDPNEIVYSQSDRSIAGLLASLTQNGSQPNLFPSLLPMLQAQGRVQTPVSNPSAALNALLTPTAVQVKSEKVNMTVLPVAVVLNAKSKTTAENLTPHALLSQWTPQSLRSAERAKAQSKDPFSLSGSLLLVSIGVIALKVWGSSVK